MNRISANFDFLGTHDEQLVRLGALAERYFKDDPNTCLIKLRQFGEVLAQVPALHHPSDWRDPHPWRRGPSDSQCASID